MPIHITLHRNGACVSLDVLETFTKHTEQLAMQSNMDRQLSYPTEPVTSGAVLETVGFHFTCCCAQRNLNIYPVCLAVAPAEGDISHL